MRWIMKITLILIIPSFILLYGWSSIKQGPQGGGGRYFIKIKETPLQIFRWGRIGESEMKEAKNMVERDYMNLLGVQNMQMARMVENLVTPEDVAAQAIDNRILHNIAEEKGLRATVGELKNQIKSMYPQAPDQALRYLMQSQGYYNEDAFINDQLYRMTINKAEFLFAGQAKASLFELWKEFLLMEEKVDLAYVNLTPDLYLDQVEITPDEAKKYYENNKEDYRTPDQVRYEYIAVKKNDLINEMEASDEEIREFYENNRETEFKVERQVRVRHIMLSLPEETVEEQINQIQATADDLYTSLTVMGADFADLADRFSEDPRNTAPVYDDEGNRTGGMKKKGGLLENFFTMERAETSPYGEEVVKAALELEEGQISEPVKGARGIHILKAEEVRPERIIPFEDAKDHAERLIKEEKAEKKFKEKRQKLYDTYEQTTTLSGLAKQIENEIKVSELVEKGSAYIPGIGSLTEFRDIIIDLQEGEMSELLENDRLLAVLTIKETVPSHIPEYGEISDQVMEDAKENKALQIAKKEAEEIVNNASDFEAFKAEIESRELEVKDPEPFVHSKPPSALSAVGNFSQFTIRTRPETAVASEAQSQGETSSYIAWFLRSKLEPSKKKFREELPNLRKEYLKGKQKMFIRENLADLRENLEYQINPDYLQSRRQVYR